MLLQNWMHQLARPTYFLELEMSPRQIWGRFLSIHLEKDEDDIKQMHKEGKQEDFQARQKSESKTAVHIML